MDISFKDSIAESDYSQIIELIDKTWNYRDFGRSDKNCKLHSTRDLYLCLSLANFCVCAYDQEKLVGYLIGRIGKKEIPEQNKLLKNKVKEITKQLEKTEEGKLFNEYQDGYDSVYLNMEKEYGLDDNFNEVIFICVDPAYKGLGIGKQMIQMLLDSLETKEKLYLHTDSTCNTEFYKHLGFSLLSTDRKDFALRDGQVIDFYLESISKVV